MTAYYNEIDASAAAWLRELIKRGLIADGDVDERSIEDVTPADVAGYTQCHFFGGIGIWSYALRQAGWPDDRKVWTGSCPCQPFSSAGKGKGFADIRHLWPAFQWLIGQCRPDCVIGEQVASKDGRAWLDVVRHEMEREGYACGLSSTVACGFGAPHKRQRLYWVADMRGTGLAKCEQQRREPGEAGGPAEGEATQRSGVLPDAEPAAGPTNGFWRDADWLFCRDGKWRPAESSFEQMVNGLACAMVYLRDGSHEKTKGLIHAAATDTGAREALRAMRESDAPEAVWLSAGRQIGFLEATVLFAGLLEHAGELGNIVDCASSGGPEACRGILRAVRPEGVPACSPPGRRLPEQLTRELADALCQLPQEGSLEVLATLNGFPLAHKAPARVVRLRGYGNAINAIQAKAFIEAYLGG